MAARSRSRLSVKAAQPIQNEEHHSINELPNHGDFKGKQNDLPSRNLSSLKVCTLLAILALLIFSLAFGSLHDDINVPPASSSPDDEAEYSLAKRQSFGYFTDISNENWRLAQIHHAKLFPNYYSDLEKYSNGMNDKGRIDNLRHSSRWYGYNFQVEFICPLARRLPSDSMADGPKWVCDPHRLAKKKDCLVYSIGSNGKNEFERAVKEEIGQHCEVHTFDMETYNKRNGHFQDALKGYADFHDWGLGTEEQAKQNPAKYKTLEQTMNELGHNGRTIDVFKIDCEWCEWSVWQQWLTVDMRQILVETHNAPMPNARDMFFGLHDAGFVVFSKEANYENGAGGVEYAFVKLSKDFFIHDSMYHKAKELPGIKKYDPVVY